MCALKISQLGLTGLTFGQVGRSSALTYACLGAFLVFGGAIGGLYDHGTLAAAVLFTAIVEVSLLAGRRLLHLGLIDFWILGFVYLYGAELTASAQRSRFYLASGNESLLEGFVVSAFGATLIGYAGSYLLRRSCDDERVSRAALNEARPEAVRFAVVLGFVAWALFTLWGGGRLLQSRSGEALNEGRGTEILGMMAIAIVIIYPTCYVLASRRLSLLMRVAGGTAMVACVASVVLAGTRYFLGFQLLAVTFAFLGPARTKFKTRRLVLAGAVGISMWIATTAMLHLRTQGAVGVIHRGTDYAAFFRVQSEGLLDILELAYEWHGLSGIPKEHLFLTYWWVPRSIWPGKPTMAGYWLIRASSGRIYSARHSASGGFALPLMLDFGPFLGGAAALAYGVVLALADRWASKRWVADWAGPGWVGLASFGAFFAVRSPITSVIMLQSLFAIFWIAVHLLRGRFTRPASRFQLWALAGAASPTVQGLSEEASSESRSRLKGPR